MAWDDVQNGLIREEGWYLVQPKMSKNAGWIGVPNCLGSTVYFSWGQWTNIDWILIVDVKAAIFYILRIWYVKRHWDTSAERPFWNSFETIESNRTLFFFNCLMINLDPPKSLPTPWSKWAKTSFTKIIRTKKLEEEKENTPSFQLELQVQIAKIYVIMCDFVNYWDGISWVAHALLKRFFP